MKTILVAFTFVVSAWSTFGQGKISMLNDASRAIVWGNAAALRLSDAALAGTAVMASPIPSSGAILLVDLYGGADASSMTLQTTTVISAAAGLFGPFNFISPNLPGGVTATMQIKVRESTFATAELALAGGGYFGFSPTFTFRPSSTIAYNSIINQGGTALSTWAPGVILVPIPLPEPSSLSFSVLAIGTLLVSRRRKR